MSRSTVFSLVLVLAACRPTPTKELPMPPRPSTKATPAAPSEAGGLATPKASGASAPTATQPPSAASDGPSVAAPLGPFVGGVARVTLAEVRRANWLGRDGRPGSALRVFLSLARPDLGLEPPDNARGNKLTSDLPEPLRPRLLYVSAPEDVVPDRGTLCDRPRFPHECELGTLRKDELELTELSHLVKITFADGAYAAVPVAIPLPPPLPVAELLEPSSAPKPGSPIAIAFRDVGADRYDVRVSLCHPYRNDGINPCLDGLDIHLEHRDGALVTAPGTSDEVSLAVRDGRIELRSTSPANYSESFEVTVEATKLGTLRGVRTRVTSHSEQRFSAPAGTPSGPR